MGGFLQEIRAVPEGNWVVLSSDQSKIIAHDPDLMKALQAARARGESAGVVMKAEAIGKSLVIPIRSCDSHIKPIR